MEDGTTKIVLNAVGTANDVDGGLKAFLDYVAGRTVDDGYVNSSLALASTITKIDIYLIDVN